MHSGGQDAVRHDLASFSRPKIQSSEHADREYSQFERLRSCFKSNGARINTQSLKFALLFVPDKSDNFAPSSRSVFRTGFSILPYAVLDKIKKASNSLCVHCTAIGHIGYGSNYIEVGLPTIFTLSCQYEFNSIF